MFIINIIIIINNNVYYYSNQAEDTISFLLIFKWINNTVQYYNIVW